jgi:AbrB family looped-hinge helix DNA binding protein
MGFVALNPSYRLSPRAMRELAGPATDDYLTSILLYPRAVANMPVSEKATTTISTKGQVILPKAIREGRKWAAGTRLVVEETPDGVLLKPVPVFAPTRPGDVAGMLGHAGPPKTVEEMDAAIDAEVRRRRARGRY